MVAQHVQAGAAQALELSKHSGQRRFAAAACRAAAALARRDRVVEAGEVGVGWGGNISVGWGRGRGGRAGILWLGGARGLAACDSGNQVKASRTGRVAWPDSAPSVAAAASAEQQQQQQHSVHSAAHSTMSPRWMQKSTPSRSKCDTARSSPASACAQGKEPETVRQPGSTVSCSLPVPDLQCHFLQYHVPVHFSPLIWRLEGRPAAPVTTLVPARHSNAASGPAESKQQKNKHNNRTHRAVEPRDAVE